jgi:Fe-Mn family superoxide dismutase
VNLIDRLKKYHFKCIVNSPSNTRFNQDDPSLVNTLKIYSQPRRHADGSILLDTSDDLRRYRVVTNIFKSFTDTAVTETTSTLIKKYLLKPASSIFLTAYEDFYYHATVHLEGQYNNWLVVGQSWQMCTHEHALGLKHLSRLPGLSFYATDFGFCKNNGGTAVYEDFASDSMDWEHIENFGYRLIPGSPDPMLINSLMHSTIRQDIDLLEATTRPAKLDTTPLPYGVRDLDPVMSEDTIEYHYEHLAKGYAKRYNAGEGDADFNRAGSFLHNKFFPQLRAPKGANRPKGAVLKLIDEKFKTYEDFKIAFKDVAMKIEGSGWVYLSTGGEIKTIKNHAVRTDICVLIDWWEHAWALEYKWDKERYLDNIWRIINWNVCNERL